MFSKIFKCVICDKEFESFYKDKKYPRIKKTCSPECHKKLMSIIQNEKMDTNCIYCGKTFKIKKSRYKTNRGKYCSKNCFYTHRKLLTPYIKITCKQCGEVFDVNEKRLNHYRKKYGEHCFKFCSRKCALQSKDKTNIESIIENILIKNGILYEFNQFTIDSFIFDFHIIDTNILIECDGDYWHNKDHVLDNIQDLNSKSKSNKDLRKSLVAIKNNFLLLRFKEFEIQHSPDIVENIIKEYLKSTWKCCACDHQFTVDAKLD